MKITKVDIINWLKTVTETIAEHKDYLTQLDAAIGDADHGINMNRGFQKVITQLPTVADKDIGTILKTVSMALISSVGGASGPLYGTFFLRASTIAMGKEELNAIEITELLKAGVAGVIQRGKANLGDKTMLDALSPAVDTLALAIEQEISVPNALQQAVTRAKQGVEETIPMLAKKGRASYLGERSIGHQDPGATSAYLILKALADNVAS